MLENVLESLITMKLYFLCHEKWKNSHAEPLLRSLNYLSEFGIKINPIFCPSNEGTPELLWPDYDDTKRRETIDEIFDSLSLCDAVIVYHRCLSAKMLRSKIPLIILEHTDGTSLEISRNFIDLENIIGVIKGSVFTNYDFYNSNLVEGMYHGNFMNSLSLPESKTKKVNPIFFNKIELGYSFGCFPSNKRFLNYELKKEKDILISFVGNIDYHRSKLVTNHRKLALSNLNKIKNSFGSSLKLKQKDYDDILLRSKFCLSPYGYGVCYRSFESIYSGSVMIQPESNYLKTWPNIFEENISYVKCNSDFSNLDQICNMPLNKYENFLSNSLKLRNILFESYWKDEIIGNHLKNIILNCIKRIKI